MEKKLGLFTEEEMNVKTVNIQQEKDEHINGNGAAAAASAPFFVAGGAVAAGGFAAASAV